MINCLTCVGLGIEDYVTLFYATLGFEPWDVFAQKRYEENVKAGYPPREYDRQTGRTTHGILEAIAYCEKHGLTELGVTAPQVLNVAMSFCARLRAPVMPRPKVHSSMYTYEDHYHG